MQISRTISRTLILVGAVMLISSSALAETFYVSLKGDDANKGMTEEAAFRTIKKGVSVVKAGDTLIIKSGNYGAERAVLKNSGRKDAPILIKAEKPGEVVLEGKKGGSGLIMIDKSYVVVEGLKFTRYGTGLVIKHRSSYVTVRKCIFLNNENAGIVLNDGGLRDPKLCHHHLFTENQFLDPHPRTQDYGLRMYFSSHVQVVNNYFHGSHNQACSFKSIMTDSRVANNVFEGFHFSAIQLGQNSDSKRMKLSSRSYRLIAEGNIFRPSPPYRAKSAIVVSNVTDAIVRNNFIDSTYGEDKKGPGRRFFPGAGIHLTRLARGTKIYGNILVNIKAPKPAFMVRSDCEIYNNTVVGCARVLDVAVGIKAVVRNNIFYKNGRGVGVAEPLQAFYNKYYGYVMNDKGVMVELPPIDKSVKSAFDYNLWVADWKSKGPGGISADPLFVGPIKPLVIQKASAKYVPNFKRAWAYRLKKTSPCIDKGVKTDLKFLGKAPDLGALEFGVKYSGKTEKDAKSQTSPAETYFVSLKGDDKSDGKTEETAFRTIKKGVSVLKAGDTLIIKSGNYGDEHVTVPASGRPDAPITIKAEKPGEVILKGKRRGTAIFINSKSYIILEGLKIDNYAPGMVIKHHCSHITVRKCTFIRSRRAGVVLNDGGIWDPKISHHHVFTENKFLDPDGRQAYCLCMYFSSHVQIVNNYFHGHFHQACSFKSLMVDCRVANNVFEGFSLSAIQLGQNSDRKGMKKSFRSYRLIAEGNTFRPAPGYRAKSAIVVSNVTDAIVRNNFIDSTYGEDKKTAGRRWFPGAGIHVTTLAVGTKIYGNVLVDVKEPKSALLIRADCEIFNNTVAGCARPLDITEGVKAVVRNNIFYKNARGAGVPEPLGSFYQKYYGHVMNTEGILVPLPVDKTKKSVFDYNLWLPDWKGKGPHGLSADPCFVGPIKALVIEKASPKFTPNFERAKAYRLTKDSPCIDKSVDIRLPFSGKAGDLGAFEFGEKKTK